MPPGLFTYHLCIEQATFTIVCFLLSWKEKDFPEKDSQFFIACFAFFFLIEGERDEMFNLEA